MQKARKIAQAHFSTPKISTKKLVNPPILKFATKQRNLLITPSHSHLFVYSHWSMFHILTEEGK